MSTLKGQINPKLGIVALIAVVAIAGYFLWHATSDVPVYAGLNAPHPAAEMSGGGKQKDLGPATPANANQMRIPGRSFNPDNPSATGGGQMPAGGQKPGP